MGSTLGQRLRMLRSERGLSQADLAGDLVSASYVSLIESGKRLPERDVVDGLARRLGVSALYLESGVKAEELTEQRLKLQFAEIALANGSIEEAREQFAALERAASAEIRLSATWGLARTEEACGDLHQAVSHLDALLGAARSGQPGAPGLLTLLDSRCRMYRDAGDFSRSIEVGEEALREVRGLGLEGTEDEIKLASTLVGAYRRRGDLFTAQHLAGGVIERAERHGSPVARAAAYWNASTVAATRGQIVLALELATKTLALLSEESSQDRNLARMRTTYAWLLLECDPPRLDDADAVLARAHEALSELNVQQNLARCEMVMARSALLRGQFTEAVRIADGAIARCADADGAELENAHVVRGLALLLAGRVDEGSAIVLGAASRMTDNGSRLNAAEAYRELAEAVLQAGRPDEAIAALRLAADCAGARSTAMRHVAARVVG
jgi:transcriptional regulator with XRE-family HTH domain